MSYAIRKELRRFESFYRIGGEEFVVLVAGGDAGDSRELAEQIREAARASSSGGVHVTVSCGVAVASGDVDIAKAIELADSAMYTAKESGRDRVVVEGGRTPARGAASAEM